MATRMNPLAGRYFNDPNMATAMSNLASAFAPPSADEALGWAQLQGVNDQNSRLSTLWSAAGNDFDRMGVAAGQWNPSQSYYAVDSDAATRRYGYDTQASTTLATNEADNDRALREAILGYAGDPSGRQGLTEEQLFGITDIPGLSFGTAGPVAPTETQVLGANLQDQLGGIPGLAEALAADGVGSISVETPEGPRLMPEGLAAIQGATPREFAGAEAGKKIVTYQTPDGRSGTGIFDPGTGSLTDEATGERLPQGTITGQVNDTAEGLGRTTTNRVDGSALAAVGALATIGQLEELIAANPGSQGLVGLLRGTAQDVMQTGNELGRFFGGTMAEVSEAASAGMIDAGLASQMFDPSIPAIQMLMNVLAWQYAKSFAGDRVSNEQLQIATRAIGASGAFQNQANSLTRLSQLRDMFQRDLIRNADILSPEVRAQAAPFLGSAIPPPGAGGGGGAGRIRYDANGNQIQ